MASVGGGTIAIVDNNHVLGQPQHIIFLESQKFDTDLEEAKLEIQLEKSQCKISEEHRDKVWNKLWSGIPIGVLRDANRASVHGTMVLNMAVVVHAFV
mmetsp:Transcript_35240/g.85009  ORF Transcript_35240/g.85009 Transcript_35240/m.85009 type:complete len:98 (+) Transcript_35240:186-479(+)